MLLDGAEELRLLLELGSPELEEFNSFLIFLWLVESGRPFSEKVWEISGEDNAGETRSRRGEGTGVEDLEELSSLCSSVTGGTS